jgi:hypothetical protein
MCVHIFSTLALSSLIIPKTVGNYFSSLYESTCESTILAKLSRLKLKEINNNILMDYKFNVNNKVLTSEKNLINGREILEKAGFTPVGQFDLYKKLQGHEFEPIQEEEQVDLAEPGIEMFKVIYRESLTFIVDDESYPTSETALTPLEIFQIIKKSPTSYYLKQILEHMEINYKNDETKSIDMLGNLLFITCKREPTTVS